LNWGSILAKSSSLISRFIESPGMFIEPTPPTSDVFAPEAIAAFVNGADVALGGTLLSGLREWLQVKAGRRSAFAWPGLIAHQRGLLAPTSTRDRAALAQAYFDELREFDKLRQDSEAIAAAFSEYAKLGK